MQRETMTDRNQKPRVFRAGSSFRALQMVYMDLHLPGSWAATYSQPIPPSLSTLKAAVVLMT